jgi:divalent metal cation (Fe/Co/Zn/Cd) transporter
MYEGVSKLVSPHSTTNPNINYIVLAVAMVFEGAAWSVAFKEFRRTKGHHGYFEAVHLSKDPTIFTVLFEDTAAMLGLIAAFVGIFLSDIYGAPIFDALASIVIGFILGATAILLAYECKGLLIGEGMRPETIEKIKASALRTPGVERVNEALTMYLGPQDVLLTISLDFDDNLSAGAVETAISELEDRIRTEWPHIRRIFVEAQSWSAHLRSQKHLETGQGESS